MTRRGAWVLAAIVAACAPAAAGAERVVDYAIDEATAAQAAVEQGVALAPMPARGATHIAVQIAPGVDHEVLRVGIACSAWKVRNPMSVLLQRFLVAWDREGAPASVPGPSVGLLIRIDRAATLSRCVGTGEMKTTCITRVSIDGTKTLPGREAQPFHVDREEATKGVGVCAGLTRGIGLVSREAASALVDQLGDTGSGARAAG